MRIFERLETKNFRQFRAFHEFVNRTSVWDTNKFAFERAIARLEPVRKKEEKLTAVFSPIRNEILGKVYGSWGRIMRFQAGMTRQKTACTWAMKITCRHPFVTKAYDKNICGGISAPYREQYEEK